MSSNRIPIILLTGFLGAGKTTLLQSALGSPEFKHSAVIVNELGQIGIDQDLIESAGVTPVLLSNGCLCCAVRGDLCYTLRDLFISRAQGWTTPFERVIIETTGIADPGPIARTLLTDPWIGQRYELMTIVTVVDAVHGAETLVRHSSARQQIALADSVVISKLDLVDGADQDALLRLVSSMNPGARMHRGCEASPAEAMLANEFNVSRAASIINKKGGNGLHDHPHGEELDGSLISCASVTFDKRVNWDLLATTLDRLSAERSRDLLRVKGIAHVIEPREPLSIHGIGATFHPPKILRRDPAGDEISRFVFIGTNGAAASIAREFGAVVGGELTL